MLKVRRVLEVLVLEVLDMLDVLDVQQSWSQRVARTAFGFAGAAASNVVRNCASAPSRNVVKRASCAAGIGSPGAWREWIDTGFTNVPPRFRR